MSLFKITVSPHNGPLKIDLMMYRNATFSNQLTLTDENDEVYDLTGQTPTAKMRKHYDSANSISLSCSANVETGIITMALGATATANIEAGRYVYDLIIINTENIVSRISQGFITVNPRVT